MEPPRKITKFEDLELKEMICSMQEIFFNKLKSIEEKIDKISTKYLMLEMKVDNIIRNIPDSCIKDSAKYIAEEYPDGSWLGDSRNPDFRIRCPITPKDLKHINDTCTSAEKMSLTLLDYLFSREVQACSNISGTGKHGKKQLDPYMIKGIKCHVTHIFGITENDWNRIKLNIDSKCRTAFRRKQKGMPLIVRGVKRRSLYKCIKKTEDSDDIVLAENLSSGSEINEKQSLRSDDESSLTNVVLPIKIDTVSPIAYPISSTPEVIHTEHGCIQVIQATKEQFEMLKNNPNVEIVHQSFLSS